MYKKDDYVIHPDEGLCEVLKEWGPPERVAGLRPLASDGDGFGDHPDQLKPADRLTLQSWGLLEGVEVGDWVYLSKCNVDYTPIYTPLCVQSIEWRTVEIGNGGIDEDRSGLTDGYTEQVDANELRLATPLELLNHEIIDELPSPRPSDCCGAHTEAVDDHRYECVLCGDPCMVAFESREEAVEEMRRGGERWLMEYMKGLPTPDEQEEAIMEATRKGGLPPEVLDGSPSGLSTMAAREAMVEGEMPDEMRDAFDMVKKMPYDDPLASGEQAHRHEEYRKYIESRESMVEEEDHPEEHDFACEHCGESPASIVGLSDDGPDYPVVHIHCDLTDALVYLSAGDQEKALSSIEKAHGITSKLLEPHICLSEDGVPNFYNRPDDAMVEPNPYADIIEAGCAPMGDPTLREAVEDGAVYVVHCARTEGDEPPMVHVREVVG